MKKYLLFGVILKRINLFQRRLELVNGSLLENRIMKTNGLDMRNEVNKFYE